MAERIEMPISDAVPYSGLPDSDRWTRWHPPCTKGSVMYGTPAWGGWANGSLSWEPEKHIHQYGRYDIRLRAWPHPLLSFHLLLWPQAEHWPPEIDICECFHADRQRISAFIHGRGKQEFPKDVDITKPTTFSVDWQADHIDFLVDDVVFGHTTDDIPHEPHRLAIQVETHATNDGFTWDKTLGRTSHYGPPNLKHLVPVVEVLSVHYTPPE